MSNVRIIVIVPAFNEAATITSVVYQCRVVMPEAAILVVDDCSTDDTARLAQDAGAIVISLPNNLGIGGAVQTGYLFAHRNNYDIAIQVDGDGQHDPVHLVDLVNTMWERNADLVIGSRFLDRNGYQSTLARRVGIRIFSGLLRLLYNVRVTDITSGFRAANKRTIKFFAQQYPYDFPEVESVARLIELGGIVSEIPVSMRARAGGHSSISSWKTIYYMVRVFVGIIVNWKPKKRIGDG